MTTPKPVAPESQPMSDEQVVLSVYPKARAYKDPCSNSHPPNKFIYTIYRGDNRGQAGQAFSEDEAWADARSKLQPAAPSPAQPAATRIRTAERLISEVLAQFHTHQFIEAAPMPTDGSKDSRWMKEAQAFLAAPAEETTAQPAIASRIMDHLREAEMEPWPKFVERASRYEDMSPTGKLTLFRQEDGDVIVEVITEHHGFERACVEFCTPMTGGGSSEHTHKALCELMVAMERDENERKQHRVASTEEKL
jgi:hypothetical protein